MDHYDIVILGGGSTAEWIWPGIPGRSIAVVEQHLLGGDCPYVACMPSKAMLRSAHLRRDLSRAAKLGARSIDIPPDDPVGAYAHATGRRDHISDNHDDSGVARRLTAAGATLIRGHGVVERAGIIRIGKLEIGYDDLVVNTGSQAVLPSIPGLMDAQPWTSDDALLGHELPHRLAVLGGGAIGCELSQVFAAFGTEVTLMEMAPHLVPAEEPEVGDELAAALRADGIRVETGIAVERVETSPAGQRLLSSTAVVNVDRIVVAAGRRPRLEGLGLEHLGIDTSGGRLAVTPELRVEGAENVWAGGDVTGIAPFTHTANYHGRVLRENLGGGHATADHRAIPRAIYTDPAVAAVGLSSERARRLGMEPVVAGARIDDTARSSADDRTAGVLRLIADPRRRTLIGAAAVGPEADEWISEAMLAVAAEIPVDRLAKLVHPFPTYSEIYDVAYRALIAALHQNDH